LAKGSRSQVNGCVEVWLRFATQRMAVAGLSSCSDRTNGRHLWLASVMGSSTWRERFTHTGRKLFQE
jgi:hypothetical protein